MVFILVLNETEQMFNMITPNAAMNFPIKRKLPGIEKTNFSLFFSLFKYRIGHATLSLSTNTEQELSSPKSNNNDGQYNYF